MWSLIQADRFIAKQIIFENGHDYGSLVCWTRKHVDILKAFLTGWSVYAVFFLICSISRTWRNSTSKVVRLCGMRNPREAKSVQTSCGITAATTWARWISRDRMWLCKASFRFVVVEGFDVVTCRSGFPELAGGRTHWCSVVMLGFANGSVKVCVTQHCFFWQIHVAFDHSPLQDRECPGKTCEKLMMITRT